MTVRDTFAELQRQCLGTWALCTHGLFADRHGGGLDADDEDVRVALHIQYEITGPGGGTWHFAVGSDDCELSDAPSPEPGVIVRASVEDWLALWAGQESVSTLLDSGRISVVTVGVFAEALRVKSQRSTAEFPSCLPFLGVLGPLREVGHVATPTPRSLQEPPDEPWYPPILDSVRFRWRMTQGLLGGRKYPDLPVDGDELGDDAPPLVEAATRLLGRFNRLRTLRGWLIAGAIASAPVGIGISAIVSWQFLLWMWFASISLPYLVRKLQDRVEARLLRLEARLLRRACESPRVFLLLQEAQLIEHVGWTGE